MKHPQIILVTGASSGFGRVIATQLAAQGHIVYGSSRKAVSDNSGFKMLQLDITDPASVANAISTILEEQGSIDVLVNNAGMGISGAIELTTRGGDTTPNEYEFHGCRPYVCGGAAFHAQSRTRTNHKYQFHRRCPCRSFPSLLQCIQVRD